MKRMLPSLVGAALCALLPAAHASLIVTLSDDGTNGVVASFSGTGSAVDASSFQIFGNVGNFTTLQLTQFTLASPVAITSDRFITHVTIDDDNPEEAVENADNFNLFLNQGLGVGTPYSASGSSAVLGLSFSSLIAGTYTAGTRIFGPFDELTLVVRGATPVPEPAALLLLSTGVLGLTLLRRKRGCEASC